MLQVPPAIRDRFKTRRCVSEIYRALLYEREAIRTAGSSDPNASENYSRIGDVLTFISRQPDIMACISAHQAVEDAYALASAPAPSLHFRHGTRNRCCYFKSFYTLR